MCLSRRVCTVRTKCPFSREKTEKIVPCGYVHIQVFIIDLSVKCQIVTPFSTMESGCFFDLYPDD